MGGKGGSAQSCAVRTALCSPSQTPPGCEIRTFHRHHHPRDAGHSPPPPPPPALLTSVASPGGCRTSPRFHPACRRPGPGSPAERGVTTAAPSHPHPNPIPHPHLHPLSPPLSPSPSPSAIPHSISIPTPSHSSSATLTCLERSGLLESTSYLRDGWERGSGAQRGWGEGDCARGGVTAMGTETGEGWETKGDGNGGWE